jgi:hypothetical protein
VTRYQLTQTLDGIPTVLNMGSTNAAATALLGSPPFYAPSTGIKLSSFAPKYFGAVFKLTRLMYQATYCCVCN